MIKDLLAYDGMLKKAAEDGYISDEERAILKSISKNYKRYLKTLKGALKDGLIDDREEEELRKIRRDIWKNALEIACEDGVISDDEKALLDILREAVGLDDFTLEAIEAMIKGKYRVL
ncbi:MAG: hypothetical protein ACE5PM_08105 [Candidatus Hydrothermarchaeales archaeon]